MAWFSVGPSSYPDLKDQTQYVNSERIAQQFLSMCRDYAVKFGKNGDRLSANEARRTRARQQALYANYVRNGYPIAAYPYTSRHDEMTHGNAIDVGVTMANGQNRALTAAEFAWMHTAAESRGFTWTGRNFATPEPWHIEGATRKEVYPPYPGITVANVIPSKPATPTPTISKQEEDDMARPTLIKTETGQYLAIGSTIVPFTQASEVSAFLKDNKGNYDTVTLKNSVAQRLLAK